MARDLKRVQLGLFPTSKAPKMPKGGGRQILLCSLHPCRTGPFLGSDLSCTVPLEPCRIHPIPAEAWECIGSLCSMGLQALQPIILQACWLLRFFSILPTASHSLPSPPRTLPLPVPPCSQRGEHRPLSAPLREQQAHPDRGSPSPSPRSSPLWEHTL